MELVTLLNTCWRRKWTIVAFTVILPIATLILCLKMKKVYEAVAKVKIVQFEDTQALLQKQIPESWGQLDHVTGIPTTSQAEVIRSRMVVGPVIEKLNLRRRVTIFDKISRLLGLEDEYPDELIRLGKLVEPGYIGAFLQRRQIYVEPLEDSDIIEVYGYSDVLEEARDMANEAAKSYVEQAEKLKQEKAREALTIIAQNMSVAQENLESTQDDLKRFQTTHSVVNLETRINDIQSNLNNLENQYLTVSNDLGVRKSRLAELSEGKMDSEELQATLKSAESYPHIQDLEAQLLNLEATLAAMLVEKTPKHPAAMELQAQISGIKKQLFAEIQRLLENEIVELGKTREALSVNIQDVKADLKRLADSNRQLQDLQRQVQSAETLYLNLRAAQDSATTAATTSYSNATIITEAETPDPDDPYYPEPALYVVLALIVGVMFGFGMAFIVEFMDISVKDTDDIRQATDLPLLGAMPKLRLIGVPKLQRLDTPNKFMGAIIEIKHNVLGHLGDKKVIAAASALRGEGKTKLLSHLAIALANEGHKVALLDLNLRRPALHKLFGVPNTKGVADLLSQGAEDASGVAQVSKEFPRITIFPAGSKVGSAMQAIASSALGNLINDLKKDHDYVLLDASALESLAGGAVVAAKADGTLLVVSMEGPPPQQLKSTVSALRNAGAEITGIVANRVRA